MDEYDGASRIDSTAIAFFGFRIEPAYGATGGSIRSSLPSRSSVST